MGFENKTLCVTKTTGYLLKKLDFKPKKSNKIITDLVKKINQYVGSRVMETKYDSVMTSKGERIVRVKMKSIDGLIQGEINYEPPKPIIRSLEDTIYNEALININFEFKAKDESLKQEYQAIAKYARKKGFRPAECKKLM